MSSSESETEPESVPVKLKPNPFLKEVKEENPRVLCMFCRTSTINDVEFGTMFQLNKITVHYYCMLFSSGLKQNGQDNEGILGFLGKDIEKELRRGEKLKCKYCKKANATVGCIVKACKASFHFTCGLSHGTLNSYIGNFPSYCPAHKPKIRIPIPVEEWNCEICYCEVSEGENPMWPPCCKKRVFHRYCIQRSALASGSYHFKCPTCKDAKVFPNAMKEAGVFVPEKDADWELEQNAFSDQATLYSICDAEECECPQGRNYNSQENTQWKVIRCGACGSQGIHMVCGQLELQKWKCPGCLEVLRRGRTCISTGDGNTVCGSGSETETDYDSSEEDVGSSEVYAAARYNIARKSSLVGVERQIDKVPEPSEFVKPVEVRPTGKNCVFDPRLNKTYHIEPFPAGADSDSEDEICIERIPTAAPEDSGSVSSYFRQFVQSNTVVSGGVTQFRADTSKVRQKFADLKISWTLQASRSDISTVLDSDKSIPQTRNPAVLLPDASDSALETSCKIRNLDLSGNEGRISLAYVSAPELDDDIEVTEVVTGSSSSYNQTNGSDCENINPGQRSKRSHLPERYKTATANGQENLLRATQSLSASIKRSSQKSGSSTHPDIAGATESLPCSSREATERFRAMSRRNRVDTSRSRSSSPEITIIEEKTIKTSPHDIQPKKKGIITFTEYDGPVVNGTPKSNVSFKFLATEGNSGKEKSGACSKDADVITLSDSDNDSGNSSGANTLTPSSSKNCGNTVSGLSESDDDIMIVGIHINGASSTDASITDESPCRQSLKSHSSLHSRIPKKKSKNGLYLFKRGQSSPESKAKERKRHKFS